jgi:O-antigen/teichoic acid export membrane protein
MQPSQPLSFRRNFSWAFVGNAVYAGCQWGILVVLAKLGSPEMVGQFTLGLAVTAPIIMFTNLQLRTVQATDAKERYLFGDYLGLRLIGTGIALLIIGTVTVFSHYRLETLLVILMIGLAKAFESISDIFCGLLQRHEQMDRIAISLIIKGLLSLLLLGIGVYLTKGILGGVIGLAMAWAIVLIGYDIPNGTAILNASPQRLKMVSNHSDDFFNSLRPRYSSMTLTQLVRVAWPLGFVMMLISFNLNIPRYFIQWNLGERELGIFGALSYLMIAGTMAVSALADSAIPRLSKYYATGNERGFWQLLLKLAGMGICVGISGVVIALIAGKQVLTLLYQADYAQYTDVFVLLMIAAAINYSFAFLGYARTAAQYFLIQVPLSSLVTITSALICFVMVPKIGLRGAAIALIFSAVVEAISNLGVVLYAMRKLRLSQKEE